MPFVGLDQIDLPRVDTPKGFFAPVAQEEIDKGRRSAAPERSSRSWR